MSQQKKNGFVKAIIVIVIAFAILAYWGYDIKRVLSSPEFKEKLGFIWNWIKDLWTNYIWVWLQWLWAHGGETVYQKLKAFLPLPTIPTSATVPAQP